MSMGALDTETAASRHLSPELAGSVCLVGGDSHPGLTDAIAQNMGLDVDPLSTNQFANGELHVRFGDSVRRRQVMLVQTGVSLGPTKGHPNGFSVNDGLMQLMLMADAARRASATEITAVMPLFPYGRQDRKTQGREPISVAVVMGMLANVGVDRVVTVDLHAQQSQAAWGKPFDHLTAEDLLVDATRNYLGPDVSNAVVIAPDLSGLTAAEDLSRRLGLRYDAKAIPKVRNPVTGTVSHGRVTDLAEGRRVITADDMIDTAGTLTSAIKAIEERGPKEIIVVTTHGIFSGEALKRLADSAVTQVIVTDTLPQDRAEEVLGDRLRVVSVAPMIGRALVEIAEGGSVTAMFPHGNGHRK